MQTRVLVTGAAGFIGSHLVESLVADGLSVRSLVVPGSDTSNLDGAQSEIVQGDIRDVESLRRAVVDVSVVYHLAAISRHDVNVPCSEYTDVNVAGTHNVLLAAESAGVKRVVFTGTIEAVGMSTDGEPLTEETPQTPRNIYGQTKLEAENLVRTFSSQHQLDTVVVRPPMTYGPREMLLLTRMFRIIEKGVYPLIGTGQALTEFCYVKNQVQGIRLAADSGGAGETYFISDERSYTLDEIVTTIAGEIGVRIWKPLIPVPVARGMGLAFEILSKVLRFYPFVIPQTGRPPFSRRTVEWTSNSRLYVDISKARRELGYSPGYNLNEGIRETIDWYRENGGLRQGSKAGGRK